MYLLHHLLPSGLSLITNLVIQEHDSLHPPPTHEEVVGTSTMRGKDMQQLVKAVVGKLYSWSKEKYRIINNKCFIVRVRVLVVAIHWKIKSNIIIVW